eukprot:TRINITY_DN67186_c0_g1_i1.p1 TRINITY_DN67186_c0_g1~~TRINITY_DN67186_c0_g1_i1.p1  ORF type:complete len:199 (-),score=42.85 TRINITY_DN67186_c0_g1_i1:67-663(-)
MAPDEAAASEDSRQWKTYRWAEQRLSRVTALAAANWDNPEIYLQEIRTSKDPPGQKQFSKRQEQMQKRVLEAWQARHNGNLFKLKSSKLESGGNALDLKLEAVSDDDGEKSPGLHLSAANAETYLRNVLAEPPPKFLRPPAQGDGVVPKAPKTVSPETKEKAPELHVESQDSDEPEPPSVRFPTCLCSCMRWLPASER